MKYVGSLAFLLIVLFNCSSSVSDEACVPTAAVLSAPSYYILQGDSFRADIYPLASGDWSSKLQVQTTDQSISTRWDNGVLKLSIPAAEFGFKKFEIVLSFATIKAKAITIKGEFAVAPQPKPIVVSHCLIKDQKNELEISIAGMPPFFDFKADNAEVEGSGPKYTITPHVAGPLTLVIFEKGTSKELGKQEFVVYDCK